MNVFVLCAGRTASTTFSAIAGSIDGYTSSHESMSSEIGDSRFVFPDNHIEVDNRLVWFIGGLDEKYGDDAVYVHLKRESSKVAKSYLKRWYLTVSIVKGFGYSVLMKESIKKSERYDVCKFYVDTVDKNIESFLKDKTKKMTFNLENSKDDFSKFCDLLGVECKEEYSNMWDEYHNENEEVSLFGYLKRLARRLKIVTGEILG